MKWDSHCQVINKSDYVKSNSYYYVMVNFKYRHPNNKYWFCFYNLIKMKQQGPLLPPLYDIDRFYQLTLTYNYFLQVACMYLAIPGQVW